MSGRDRQFHPSCYYFRSDARKGQPSGSGLQETRMRSVQPWLLLFPLSALESVLG